MSLKSVFNTLVTGQYEMLRINKPLTLVMAGGSVVTAAAGMMVVSPGIIGGGLGLAACSLTLSYLLGSRVERRRAEEEARRQEKMRHFRR
jgi:hypothetical protein